MSPTEPALTSRVEPSPVDWQWHVLARSQEYVAEARSNLLRAVCIGVFYAIELLNYYGLRLGSFKWEASVDRDFHVAVTAAAFAWIMVVLTTQLCLTRSLFPPALKYATTAADLLLLTAVLLLADGPRSPLVVGYFLIILLAGLRLSLRLVWCSTAGAVVGYLAVLAYARWFAEPGRVLNVSHAQQAIMISALLLAGVILGQIVRRWQAMAAEYAVRLRGTPEGNR